MAYIYNIADRWNDISEVFNGILLDVDDQASHASSKLIDLKVGGSSKFSVSKTGILLASSLAVTGSVTASSVSSTSVVSSSRVLIGTASIEGPDPRLYAFTNTDVWAAFFGDYNNSHFRVAGTASGISGYSLLQSFSSGETPGSKIVLQQLGGRVVIGGSTDDGSTLLQVLGTQKTTANSASPALAATQNGAGFALQAIGPSETQLLLTSDPALTNYYQIGRKTADGLLWFTGSQAGFTGYVFRGPDGEQMRSTVDGLAVTGSISATGVAALRTINATSDYTALQMGTAGTAYGQIGWGTGGEVVYNAAAGATRQHVFQTSGTNRMLVDAAGANVIGSVNASGGIESLASVSITKDGSDSIGSGSLMQVRNASATRSWAQQLSASNNLDWWHLDGSWAKYMTLSTAGLAVTGIQTITANSASPALDIVQSGAGFSLRAGVSQINGYLDVQGSMYVTGNQTITSNSSSAALTITQNGVGPAQILHTGTNSNIWAREASIALGGLTGPALSGINDAASALTDLTLQAANVNIVIDNTLKGKWTSTGLAVMGDISLWPGKFYSTLSPDGATQFSALASNGGSTDLISYLGSGGGHFRIISGDSVGNLIVGTWGRGGLAVTGNVTASGAITNDNYGLTQNAANHGYWFGAAGTRFSGVYTGDGTQVYMRAGNQDLFQLTGTGLSLIGAQTITANTSGNALLIDQNGSGFGIRVESAVNGRIDLIGEAGYGMLFVQGASDSAQVQLNSSGGSGRRYSFSSNADGTFSINDETAVTSPILMSTSVLTLTRTVNVTGVLNASSSVPGGFASDVTNTSTSGYGLTVRTAATGGEYAFGVRNNTDSATNFRVVENGSMFALSGVFEYGAFFPNNTGVIYFRDSGGVDRRAFLRAADQFIIGDVDNVTVDSYLSLCANLSQRHVINNNQIGVWSATGLGVTGIIATSSSMRPKATPSTAWGIDFAESSSVANCLTLADGATYDLASGSGIVVLHDETSGSIGVFACYAGAVVAIADPAAFFSVTVNTASKVNIYYNGSTAYRIQNNTGVSVQIYVAGIRTRTNS